MGERAAFEARRFFAIYPPVADTSGKGPIVLATSSTPIGIDLTTVPGHQTNKNIDASNDEWNPNPLSRYLFVQADTVDAYILFGPTYAAVTSVSASSTSSVDGSGVVTQAANGSIRIPAGTGPLRFLVPADFNTRDRSDFGKNALGRFLGVVTGGSAGLIRIYQCSP